MFDNQLQHDLVQVGTMISTVAPSDMHNLLVRFLVAVITAIHMEAGALEMGKRGREAKTRGGGCRNETVEFRHSVSIEAIQSTTKGIIVELVRGNAGRNQAGGGLILEESGTRYSA